MSCFRHHTGSVAIAGLIYSGQRDDDENGTTNDIGRTTRRDRACVAAVGGTGRVVHPPGRPPRQSLLPKLRNLFVAARRRSPGRAAGAADRLDPTPRISGPLHRVVAPAALPGRVTDSISTPHRLTLTMYRAGDGLVSRWPMARYFQWRKRNEKRTHSDV